MPGTYTDLAKEAAKRGFRVIQGVNRSVIDSAAQAPAQFVSGIADKKEWLAKKVDTAKTVLEAKFLIHDKLNGDIDEAEFAWRLANDKSLRATVSTLTEQVLQPTPVTTDPQRKNNAYLDIGAGVSAFWNEMRQKLPVELSNASEIENILLCVDEGLDPDLEPGTRKMFLQQAGLDKDQISKLVPLSEYITYEERAKNKLRDQIKGELGITGDMDENQALLVESMLEDRMMGQKLLVDDTPREITYEEQYGISAEEMYDLFGDLTPQVGSVPESGVNVSVSDPSWKQALSVSGAETAYQNLLNGTVSNNLVYIHSLEVAISRDQKQSMAPDVTTSEAIVPGDMGPDVIVTGAEDFPGMGPDVIVTGDINPKDIGPDMDDLDFGDGDPDIDDLPDLTDADLADLVDLDDLNFEP